MKQFRLDWSVCTSSTVGRKKYDTSSNGLGSAAVYVVSKHKLLYINLYMSLHSCKLVYKQPKMCVKENHAERGASSFKRVYSLS